MAGTATATETQNNQQQPRPWKTMRADVERLERRIEALMDTDGGLYSEEMIAATTELETVKAEIAQRRIDGQGKGRGGGGKKKAEPEREPGDFTDEELRAAVSAAEGDPDTVF